METLQLGEETVPQSIVLAVSGLASGSVSLTQIPNHFEKVIYQISLMVPGH